MEDTQMIFGYGVWMQTIISCGVSAMVDRTMNTLVKYYKQKMKALSFLGQLILTMVMWQALLILICIPQMKVLLGFSA